MKRKYEVRRMLTCLVVLLSVTWLFGEEPGGVISGIVTDEKGDALSDAEVSPEFTGVAVMHALVKTVKTDQNGHYRIDGLAWGPYEVYAGKEAEGYANTTHPLYRSRPVPAITLSPANPIACANVVIGPRAGVLVASVRDAASNVPLPSQLV